jgi:hypothetical protein
VDDDAGLGGWAYYQAYSTASRHGLKAFVPSKYDILVAKADPAKLIDVAKRRKGKTEGQQGSLPVSGFEVLRGGPPTVVHGISAGFRGGSLDLTPFCFDSASADGSTAATQTSRPRVCVRGTSFKADCEAASKDEVSRLRGEMAAISRLLILSQTATEQRVRAEGQSGLNQVRAWQGGLRSYHGASFSGGGVANIHDHADYRTTIGMGELGAVLNGKEMCILVFSF